MSILTAAFNFIINAIFAFTEWFVKAIEWAIETF